MRESGGTLSVNSEKEKPKRPLKPIIITRDAIQKEIFGMGYKNLPVFSIEEFYEQRVRDGWFPSSNSNQQNSLMNRALDSDAAHKSEEAEEIKNEALEENDDPEELARKRNF